MQNTHLRRQFHNMGILWEIAAFILYCWTKINHVHRCKGVLRRQWNPFCDFLVLNTQETLQEYVYDLNLQLRIAGLTDGCLSLRVPCLHRLERKNKESVKFHWRTTYIAEGRKNILQLKIGIRCAVTCKPYQHCMTVLNLSTLFSHHL